MTRRRHTPPAWPYALLILAWLAVSASLARQSVVLWREAAAYDLRGWLLAALLGLATLAQIVALFYLLGLVTKAVSYLLMPRPAPVGEGTPAETPVAVLYLTAGDFDPQALDSLLRLEYPGPKLFLVHDDGSDAVARARIERRIEEHPCSGTWHVAVLHRPQRIGGKAGAVNWVLDRLDPVWELLLLCDSDSIALDPRALGSSVGEFVDPNVAAVQFRNVGFAGDDEPEFQRRMARAIDVFDALAAPQAAWGYLPFFGHNAVLRVEDVRRLGGLTPGFFSDDLDLSARITLNAKRIVYRRDIAFGERHPADWAGFRKRACKWALGCMQVVRARGWAVLTRPGIPFAHRVGLLEFMGFYPAQALLVVGLFLRHLLLPWMLPAWSPGPGYAIVGWFVAAAILPPTFAWSLRERRLREWPQLAWACSLVYGGSILATVSGVWSGLSGRERPWVPTNLTERRPSVPRAGWIEAALGLALVVVPWWFRDPVLGFPATYFFLAVFLFSPLTFAAYREPQPRRRVAREQARPPRPLVAASGGMFLAFVLLVLAVPDARATALEVRGDRLMLGGRPFQVRGVHYSPWLPGTGPDGHSPYPGAKVVEDDLARIRALGANAIEVVNAPSWVVDRAAGHGLVTIYAFDLTWSDTSRAAFERQERGILAAVDSLRAHSGVAMWILGHEVPQWVVEQLGQPEVEGRLRELAGLVRARDPAHPLGHANWPPTKDLDLSSFDVACFNLYPAWPYEVAVKGYGPYLRDVLHPLTRGRPLLVTEFGINSLEAGEKRQAEVLRDCWREIDRSGTAGGVVFEWCDEWWKNFDNPITGKGYWQRAYDADDAKRLDNDPEEHYGIVTAQREAKPALAAVQGVWKEDSGRARLPWLVLVPLAVFTWLVMRPARKRVLPRRAEAAVRGVLVVFAIGMAAPRVAHATWSTTETVTGANANDQFGWSLAGIGDVIGDGRGDIGVGAHFFTVGSYSAAGAAYVYAGGHVPGTVATIRLDGISADEHFGESLAGGADVDGDGRDDLVVGAPLRTVAGLSAAGAVDVFRGGALSSGAWQTLGGEAADDWFGQSVAVGDLNGDGKADIIVGAPYNDRAASAAGAVFIYLGGAVSTTPWRVLVGEAANDQFGWSVAYLGDFDGDGYGDLAVGARLHGTGTLGAAGKVYLFRGGTSMSTAAARTWTGEAKDDWFGNSVAGPGDASQGGRADLLVGAPYNDRGGSAAGAAYLFRGEDPAGSPPAAIYVGEIANAQFGWSVSGAGDISGDYVPDVMVGARMQPVGALSAAGRAYVFAGGSTLSTTPWITADGEQADDWFGNAVGGGTRYFSTDTFAALAGAPYNDIVASAAGSAYAFGGQPFTVGVEATPEVGRSAVWPNPAVRSVTVRWLGTPTGDAQVLDTSGRVIREVRPGGSGMVQWDLRDAEGHRVPPGIYFLRATSAAALTPPTRLVVLP